MIIADVADDPDRRGEKQIVFSSVDGFEPPVLEEELVE